MVLLLGADQGEPVRQFAKAEAAIQDQVGSIAARSRDHWTRPWGFEATTLFLNRAILVHTGEEPVTVMRQCLEIERALGRQRCSGGGYTSRTIDIDLLLAGDQVVLNEDVVLPHPRLHLRRFALSPLCDLLPLWTHPVLGRTALDLLNALPPA